MKRFIILILFQFSFNLPAWGQGAGPQSQAEFCSKRQDPSYFVQMAYDSRNSLAFRNKGGLFNGGVCWWHSLFQRASLYLAVYRPELPKPSAKRAKAIVHAIAAGRQVVEIPGYRNMREFSSDWESLIQDKLEEWQRVDGFLKFKWIQGLSGSTSEKPEKIMKKLDFLVQAVHQKREIHWAMMQLKGISAHSALLIDMQRNSSVYWTRHLDSNFVGQVMSFDYKIGDTSIFSPSYGAFVLYPGRTSDLVRFQLAGDQYCDPQKRYEFPIEELDPLYNGWE